MKECCQKYIKSITKGRLLIKSPPYQCPECLAKFHLRSQINIENNMDKLKGK